MTNPGMPVSAAASTLENADTRLPALRDSLNAVRMRSRLALMLRGLVFSLVVALALLCGLEVFGLHFDTATPAASLTAPSGPTYLAWSVIAFGCAFAVATVSAFLLTPDIGTLARKVDRVLALKERLSTALEVDTGSPPPVALGPIRAALLADAERHSAAIDPRQIVGFKLPRATWAVPGLFAVAVLLQLVPPDALAISRGPIAGAQRDDGGFSGQQGSAAAANLRRIAELFGKDAEERSDPYLRSIARTLERLSSEPERPGADLRVLANALDRLLGHARQAYGQTSSADRGATQRDAVQQLQAALDDIAGNRHAEAAALRQPDDGVHAGNVAETARGQASPPAQPSERKAAGIRTGSKTATPNRQPSWEDLLKDLDDYDPVDPRIEKERAFADQQRRARAASQSAGAAQDAGQGDGDRAGEGTRPLGYGGSTALTELTPGAEMLLPDQPAPDGGRIRMELPPDVLLSGVAPPTAGSGTGAEWQRAREEAVARAAPSAEDRKILGRYFVRSGGGRGP
jgi:hypothetical protein